MANDPKSVFGQNWMFAQQYCKEPEPEKETEAETKSRSTNSFLDSLKGKTCLQLPSDG